MCEYLAYYVWLGNIVNTASLIVYAVVIYYLQKLSTNRYVVDFPQRKRKIRVVLIFTWIAFSDLVLDVIPYVIIKILLSTGRDIERVVRFIYCLIILNRCANVFICIWKFKDVRKAAWKLFRCKYLSTRVNERMHVRYYRCRERYAILLGRFC